MASAGWLTTYVPDGSSDNGELLAQCCFCLCNSVNDPVLLNCLHNCCRRCLEGSALSAADAGEPRLECPLCQTETKQSDCSRNNVLCGYAGIMTLQEDCPHCRFCQDEGKTDEAAEYWCANCIASLCANCYGWHNKFNPGHRSAQLSCARDWPRSYYFPAPPCSAHRRPLENLCFTCNKVKCVACLASCSATAHEWRTMVHASSQRRAQEAVVALMQAVEVLNRVLTALQNMVCASAGHVLQARKRLSADVLPPRKQVLLRAVDRAYQRGELEVHSNLDRVKRDCPKMSPGLASSAALGICYAEFSVKPAEAGLCAIAQRSQLIVALRCRTAVVRAAHCRLLDEHTKGGSFDIAGAVPLTADMALEGCFGSVRVGTGPPAAPLSFDREAYCKFRPPVNCYDIAVMNDGRVLLAVKEHGILEYGTDGRQLSSWRPPKLDNGRDNSVITVEVLSDGRTAVGTEGVCAVLLLRRRDACHEPFEEEGRVTGLRSFPLQLGAYRHLMAIAEGTYNPYVVHRERAKFSQLVIVRLISNGAEHLYRQTRDYVIRGVAITALCVVTSSEFPKKLNSGISPFVVDAHSHAGEFLWRRELDDSEGAAGVCAAATWHQVYISVWGRDGDSGSVLAIEGADGREQRSVITAEVFKLELPIILSLSVERQAVLAVLSLSPSGDIVSVYIAGR